MVTRTDEQVDQILSDLRPWLFRLALAIVGQPDLAEDVAQDTLVRANRSRLKLRHVAEPRAWLRSILIRRAMTAMSRKRSESLLDSATEDDPTESIAVRQTLGRLQPQDRVILAIWHFERLSYEEMADTLKIPIGTVGSRLHTAREAFRKEWEK